MKLTTKGRYAVMAMADLALYKDKGPISLTDISIRQNISLAYLEQIFIKLKQVNLVKSVRGAKGGYVLDSSPEEIKISNIISAVDEEIKTLNPEILKLCKKYFISKEKTKIFVPQDTSILSTYYLPTYFLNH